MVTRKRIFETGNSLSLTGQETCPTRRRALAMILGTGASVVAHAGEAPVRLAISESLVSDVSMADARAAMQIWVNRMMSDMKVTVELNPKVFEPREEVLRRVRSGTVDALAINVLEYRQVAEFLDPSQIISETGGAGHAQYLLLTKRDSGIKRLADLRRRKLCQLKAPRMCVADAWLATLLEESHLGAREQFLGPVTSDTKVSRVVLPVFFGQSDACMVSKQGFDTMCELNPQVGKDLTVLATSAPMVVTFYVFHRDYHGASRERFAKVYTDLPNNVAGRQLATLFQFDSLVVRNIGCLAPALSVLATADRNHSEGTRK